MSITGKKSEASKRRDAEESQVPAPHVPLEGDGDGFFSEETWAGIAKSLGLSPREAEIARCIAADQGNRQIAHTLGISSHTVRSHLVHLYQKMGVQSRVGVVKRLVHAHRDLHPPIEVGRTSD